MATTTPFTMDFDHNKPLYPEDQLTSYLETSMDYGLAPFPQSPAYGISVGRKYCCKYCTYIADGRLQCPLSRL